MGSYKPCTHPHPPTLTHNHSHPPLPSQKQVSLTHTHPHQVKRKGHTYPYPPTPSQKKVTLTTTQPQSTKKRSNSATSTHIQIKEGHIYPHVTEIKNVTCLTHTYKYSLFTILAGVFIFEKDNFETAFESIVCLFVFND